MIHLNVDRNGVITGMIDHPTKETEIRLDLSQSSPVEPRPRPLPRVAQPHPQAQINRALKTAAELGLVRDQDEAGVVKLSPPARTAPRSYLGWSPPEQLISHYAAMYAEMQESERADA